jgi:hypothetical protein
MSLDFFFLFLDVAVAVNDDDAAVMMSLSNPGLYTWGFFFGNICVINV